MLFALMFNSNAEEYARRDDPAQAPAYWAAWRAYMDAVNAAGVAVGGAQLEVPGTATTVRIRDGERFVQDGPYADTRELLGGFLLIDVPSLDEALQWAARSPSSSAGSTEVRPMKSPAKG
jgi:hypothetical protein